jgi:hypothetical protein
MQVAEDRLGVAAGQVVVDVVLAAQLDRRGQAGRRQRLVAPQATAKSAQTIEQASSNGSPPERPASSATSAPRQRASSSPCGTQVAGVVYRCSSAWPSQCRSSTASASIARRSSVRRRLSSGVATLRPATASRSASRTRLTLACASRSERLADALEHRPASGRRTGG